MISKYRHNASPKNRIVLVVESELLENIDQWGVSAGMTSRTAAIKTLINEGLEAVKHETAA